MGRVGYSYWERSQSLASPELGLGWVCSGCGEYLSKTAGVAAVDGKTVGS